MADQRLIDANALLCDLQASHDWLLKIYEGLPHEEAKRVCSAEIATFLEIGLRIQNAPTIDAVPVVPARWVDNHCTACGMMPMGEEQWEHLDLTPPRMEFFMSYCPCCGAKMDAKEV